MSANEIEVKISAQLDELISGFAQAQSTVTSSLDAITGKIAEVGDALDTKLRQGGQAAQQHLKDVQGATVNLGQSLNAMRGAISTALEVTGIAATLAIFDQVAGAIERITGRAVQFHVLSEVVGVTTDQLQGMAVAADESGVSIEHFARAAERMSVMLTQARNGSGAAVEKLKALGVTNAEIASSTFGVNELLGVLHERLTDSATSTSTMSALVAQLGPRYAMVAEAIKEYDGSLQGVANKMAQVNGLTEQQITEQKKLHAELELLETKIANTSGELLVWYKNLFLANLEVLKTITGIEALTKLYKLHQEAVAATAAAQDQSSSDNAVAHMLDGMSMVARAALESAQNQINANHNVTDEEIADNAKREAAAKQSSLKQIEGDKEAIAATKDGTAARLAAVKKFYDDTKSYFTGLDDIDKVREAHTQLLAEERKYQAVLISIAETNAKTKFETQLAGIAQEEDAVRQERKLGQISAEEEYARLAGLMERKKALQRTYYATIEKLAQDDARKQAGFQQQQTAADLADQRALMKDKDALAVEQQQRTMQDAESAAKEQLDATLTGIAAQQSLVEGQYKRGQINAQQEYTQLVQLLEQKLQAQMAYYNAVEAADAGNVQKMAANLKKLNSDEQAYMLDVTKQQQTTTDAIAAKWKKMADSIADAMSGAVMGMINGTETFRQAMLKMGDQVLSSFITNTFKMVAEHLLGQEAQAQATVVTGAVKLSADKMYSEESTAISARTTMSKIMNDAHSAFTGAYNAVVGIPYIGPVLAPAAGAAAFAAVMAMDVISSAAGGYVLPSDQMVMAHQNEMILPASISQGLQGMIAQGAGSGTSSGGQTINLSPVFQISSIDTQSGVAFLRQHAPTIARELRTQLQRFNPHLTKPV